MLIGGFGDDLLVGGAGADRFVFDDGDTPTDTTGANMSSWAHGEKILDFSHAEGDKIDLSAIDANAALPGNQAFTIASPNVFYTTDLAPGEVSYFTNLSSGTSTVFGNTGQHYFAFEVQGDGPECDDFIL